MKFLKTLLSAIALSASAAVAASPTFSVFNPGPSGMVKSNGSYTLQQALAADIIALFSGCSGTQYLGADGACHTVSGGGSVSSVGLSMPSGFTVSGSPVTTSGTLSVTTTLSGLLKGNGSGFTTAASADIIGLWSGTCSASTYLRGDGSCQTPAGGGGTPGGSNTDIQYNNSGAFAGSANFTFDGTHTVTLGDTIQGILEGAAPRTVTSNGVPLTIEAGNGGSTSGNGGQLNLLAGVPNGSGSGAAVQITASSAVSTSTALNGGAVLINGGWGINAGVGGRVQLAAGEGGTGGIGGDIELYGGNSGTGTVAGGAIHIRPGGGTPDGAITFETGTTDAIALTMGSDGGITVGAPTGGDKGIGTINVQSGIYSNGALVPSISGSITTGHCAEWASASTLEDSGAGCAAGGGGVTSVGLTTPSWLTVTGSPVTTSGTLAVSATTGETANEFLATPNGSTGAVSLRAIVATDIPTLNQNTTGNAATATALASTPTQCSTGQWSTGIAASGNANCSRVLPNVNSASSATSVTPNCTYDIVKVTASATGTFTINAPNTCTAVDGQEVILKITSPSGGTITYSWNAAYLASAQLSLPTASNAASKEDYFAFRYDSDKTGWVLLAYNQGF